MASSFEDAKLILTPNAYKAGKAYCVKPFDGSGDLTVVRNTTATRIDENGLREVVGANVPRLNYPIGGGCPSWLIEPQATNLLQYSEEFDNAYWTKSNATIIADDATAPDGTMTADKVTLTLSSGRIEKSISLVIDAEFTLSSFIKNIDASNSLVGLVCFNNANTICNATFELTGSGSVTSQNNAVAKITSFENGWYRCSITFNSESGSTSPSIRVVGNVTGSGGFTTGESVYLWGAQLEQGNLTSYIPTTATAVTRNADVLSKTGISSLIGQTEGVFYVECAFLNNDLTPKYITISDNTNSKRIILASTNVSNQVRIQLVDGVSQVEIFHTLSDITNYNKFAFSYTQNNFKFFINGSSVGSDNSGTVPSGFDTLLFANPANIAPFYGDVKSLILFDVAKTDAELINLTTI